jgi:hypothetical protein
MKLQYFFGWILAAASLAVWPEIGLAHGGGGGGGGGHGAGAAVTDLEGEVKVEDTLLSVVVTDSVVVTHLADSLAVLDSAGRGDFLLVDFLVAEITAALVTVVSADAIATFRTVAFAILMGTLSISASMDSDIRIITRTTTPMTMHTPITTTMLIKASILLGTTERLDPVSWAQLCNRH